MKMARPAKPNNASKKVGITIRVDEEVYRIFSTLLVFNRDTVQGLFNKTMDEYIKTHKHILRLDDDE
jgi:hypothetical protein